MLERDAPWLTIPFALASAIAVATVLLSQGPLDHRIGHALEMTGRWSFLFFWLAYAGPSLAPLCGAWLNKGRHYGLAYASAHTVHVGLVIWLLVVAPTLFLPPWLPIFFAVGVIFTYLLVGLSWAPAVSWVGATRAKHIRRLAMQYIFLAFAYDLVLSPLREAESHPFDAIKYAPFTIAALAAPMIRLWRLTRFQRRTALIDATGNGSLSAVPHRADQAIL